MVTQSDSYNTLDIGQYYVISSNKERSKEFYTRKNLEVKSVNSGFTYNSGQNEAFLTIDEIRKLIEIFSDTKLGEFKVNVSMGKTLGSMEKVQG